MRRICLITTAFFFIAVIVSYAYGEGLTLDGSTFEETNKRCIPSLTVKLILPRNLMRPEKITTTDMRGEFHFTNLDKGRYLLEIYQGVTILYRDVIEINKNTRKDISLRRKS